MLFFDGATIRPSYDMDKTIHSSGVVCASGKEEIDALKAFVQAWNNKGDIPKIVCSELPQYAIYNPTYGDFMLTDCYNTKENAMIAANETMVNDEIEAGVVLQCWPVAYATYQPRVTWH